MLRKIAPFFIGHKKATLGNGARVPPLVRCFEHLIQLCRSCVILSSYG